MSLIHVSMVAAVMKKVMQPLNVNVKEQVIMDQPVIEEL